MSAQWFFLNLNVKVIFNIVVINIVKCRNADSNILHAHSLLHRLAFRERNYMTMEINTENDVMFVINGNFLKYVAFTAHFLQ